MVKSESLSTVHAKFASQEFVAVDWGTSSFRLWHICSGGNVIAKINTPVGMSTIGKSDYAAVLNEQIVSLNIGQDIPVVVCGMAGAAQGWYEAPYVSADENLPILGRKAVRVPGQAREVYILPGVMQTKPANIMRGEETQILGFLADMPDFEGTICLPGTHSKWVKMRNGKIDSFTTFMTGEIFALLSEKSVLKHSMLDQGWDDLAFMTAVKQAIASPERVAELFFSLRASLLLENQSAAIARARLSGILIGMELAAVPTCWKSSNVVLIGEHSLCQKYCDALAQQRVDSKILNAQTMTLQGLIKGFEQINRSSANA